MVVADQGSSSSSSSSSLSSKNLSTIIKTTRQIEEIDNVYRVDERSNDNNELFQTRHTTSMKDHLSMTSTTSSSSSTSEICQQHLNFPSESSSFEHGNSRIWGEPNDSILFHDAQDDNECCELKGICSDERESRDDERRPSSINTGQSSSNSYINGLGQPNLYDNTVKSLKLKSRIEDDNFNDLLLLQSNDSFSTTNDPLSADENGSLLPCHGPLAPESHERYSASSVDPYEILQIHFDANPLEIRQAYCRAALFYHPTRSSTKSGGDSTSRSPSMQPSSHVDVERKYMFALLSAAYETLSDKTTRQSYDCEFYTLTPMNAVGVSPRCSSFRRSFSQSPRKRNGAFFRSMSPQNRSTHHSFDNSDENWDLDYEPPLSPLRKSPRKLIHGKQLKPNSTRVGPSSSTGPSNQKSTNINRAVPSSLFDKEHLYSYKGPLSEMYKARRYAPFQDPYELFDATMGSKLFTKPRSESNASGERHTQLLGSGLLKEGSRDDDDSYNDSVIPRTTFCGAIGRNGSDTNSGKDLALLNNDGTPREEDGQSRLWSCGTGEFSDALLKSPLQSIGRSSSTTTYVGGTTTDLSQGITKPSSCWKGTAIAAPDDSIRISRTTRIVQPGSGGISTTAVGGGATTEQPAYRVTKTEITTIDPNTGQRETSVKVFRHDSVTELDDDDMEFQKLYDQLESERHKAGVGSKRSGIQLLNNNCWPSPARRNRSRGGSCGPFAFSGLHFSSLASPCHGRRRRSESNGWFGSGSSTSKREQGYDHRTSRDRGIYDACFESSPSSRKTSKKAGVDSGLLNDCLDWVTSSCTKMSCGNLGPLK